MWYATWQLYPEVNKEFLKGITQGPNRIQFAFKKKITVAAKWKMYQIWGVGMGVWGDQLQGYCICPSEKEMFLEWVLLHLIFRGQSHRAGGWIGHGNCNRGIVRTSCITCVNLDGCLVPNPECTCQELHCESCFPVSVDCSNTEGKLWPGSNKYLRLEGMHIV